MKKLWNSLCLALLCITLFSFYPTQQCYSQGFYDNFSWRTHQQMNFLTPPKDQVVQGPCNIFAAIAQVESMYKLLYFNAGANLDLSEYQLHSQCTNFGIYTNIYPFLEDYGVVQENCSGYTYPVSCNDLAECYMDCEDDCCEDPDCLYRYSIVSNTIDIGSFNNDKEIQDAVYKYGPIQMNADNYYFLHQSAITGGHALLLHGWETDVNNKLWWLFKDSWKDSASLTFKIDASAVNLTSLFDAPQHIANVITKVDKWHKVSGNWIKENPDRYCNEDNDGDGYCFWGVGEKPASCTHTTHSEQDYDDNDDTLGPLDHNTGLPMKLPPQPYQIAPVAQTYIYGPAQSGTCSSSHSINSSYWKNITGDQIDWVPYYGSTPTSYTGPSGNAPGGSGLYLYLEATGGCYNQKGIAESKYHYYIPTGSTDHYLKYYYHMYGSSMGSLKVKLQEYGNTSWVEYGSIKSGNKGNLWIKESISLSGFKGKSIKIRFEGTTGWGQYSDMAIQNISIVTSAQKSAEVESISEMEGVNPIFEIFPNPASNLLNITTKESVEYNLSIFNTVGQVVYQKELKSNHVVDVERYPSGIYFMQIKYNDPEEKVFVQNVVIN